MTKHFQLHLSYTGTCREAWLSLGRNGGCALLGGMIKNKKTPPSCFTSHVDTDSGALSSEAPLPFKEYRLPEHKLEASHPQSAKTCKNVYIQITRLCCVHLYQSWYFIYTNNDVLKYESYKVFLTLSANTTLNIIIVGISLLGEGSIFETCNDKKKKKMLVCCKNKHVFQRESESTVCHLIYDMVNICVESCRQTYFKIIK